AALEEAASRRHDPEPLRVLGDRLAVEVGHRRRAALLHQPVEECPGLGDRRDPGGRPPACRGPQLLGSEAHLLRGHLGERLRAAAGEHGLGEDPVGVGLRARGHSREGTAPTAPSVYQPPNASVTRPIAGAKASIRLTTGPRVIAYPKADESSAIEIAV